MEATPLTLLATLPKLHEYECIECGDSIIRRKFKDGEMSICDDCYKVGDVIGWCDICKSTKICDHNKYGCPAGNISVSIEEISVNSLLDDVREMKNKLEEVTTQNVILESDLKIERAKRRALEEKLKNIEDKVKR